MRDSEMGKDGVLLNSYLLHTAQRYENKSFPINNKPQRKPSQAAHGVYAYLFTQVNELEVYAFLRDSDCSCPHRGLSPKLELLYDSKLELNRLLHGRWRALHCNTFQKNVDVGSGVVIRCGEVIQPGPAIEDPKQFGKRDDAGSGHDMKNTVFAKQPVSNDEVDVRALKGLNSPDRNEDGILKLKGCSKKDKQAVSRCFRPTGHTSRTAHFGSYRIARPCRAIL